MRLARITTNYPAYLKSFYSKNRHLINANYNLQHQSIMKDGFGWANFWDLALENIGYVSTNYIANAEIMQKKWAMENGLRFTKNWFDEIIHAQINKFQPDVLFVDDYISFSKDFLRYLRISCPSIKLILGWCGAPFSSSSDVFSAYDIVLSNIPELVLYFQQNGHQAIYIRHAFSPSILNNIDLNTTKSIDCSFVGSIMTGGVSHNQRADLIKYMINNTNIDIFGLIPPHGYLDRLFAILKDIAYINIKNFSRFENLHNIMKRIPKVKKYIDLDVSPNPLKRIDSAILDKIKPPLFGLEMFQILVNSKVSLNNHIDVSRSSASNMRLFEVTGVSSCLLTDWKPNLQEMFDIDREIVTYSSIEECAEKVKWLIENPKERDMIAKSGQARTLRDHTFDNRAVILDEIIQDFFKNI